MAYLPEDSFVTAIAAAVDPRTGEVEYVNAGHMAALVFGTDGSHRALAVGQNPPLGVAACSLSTQTDRLGPGDVLLLYTDGITELKNGAREMLGDDRLAVAVGAICKGSETRPLDTVGEALNTMLDEFRGEELPEDDRAFLLVRLAP